MPFLHNKSRLEKGGFPFDGINLALCENPLPPIEEAIEAAKAETYLSNYYTEPYSQRLKERISNYANVPMENIHINAGSELILRQLFSLFGKRVHLISPTYYLFEEIGGQKTHTTLNENEDFLYDIKKLTIPEGTTLSVVVNPNNPNGAVLNIKDNLSLIESHPDTMFLIDEAFIEFGGGTAADLISKYKNIIITRTFSKAFSLAGCRVGYVIGTERLIDHLNSHNDAYPLARTAEAAALATLEHVDKIRERVIVLRSLAKDFAGTLKALGVKTYPSETYFFVGKVPHMDADHFAEALGERNIHIRPLHHEGLGNKFLRFATSTAEQNRTVLKAIKEILGVRTNL
jgi:histidinol-phosphate aminotransferase